VISEETKMKWHTQLNTIQLARQANVLELNEWEAGFIDGVFNTMQANNGMISFKQSSVLSKIYKRIG